MEGLTYIENFISSKRATQIVDYINQQEWNTELSRRTQHYGYTYDYKGLDLTEAEPIPDIFKLSNLKEYNFDQVIVNEYTRNQGITAHIDNIKYFGPIVASVSFLVPTEMIFTKGKDNSYSQILEPRSCVILEGDARYKWSHAISKNVTFMMDGEKYIKPQDYRRISLTYRTVIN